MVIWLGFNYYKWWFDGDFNHYKWWFDGDLTTILMVIWWWKTPNLVMKFTVRHGISMALIEIDGLPFLIAWWFSMANC